MNAVLSVILLLLMISLWFWAIIDIANSRFKDQRMNTVWLLIVLFFPLLGSIIHFQLKRRLTSPEARKFSPDFNHS